jgi:hypothetical protein
MYGRFGGDNRVAETEGNFSYNLLSAKWVLFLRLSGKSAPSVTWGAGRFLEGKTLCFGTSGRRL